MIDVFIVDLTRWDDVCGLHNVLEFKKYSCPTLHEHINGLSAVEAKM